MHLSIEFRDANPSLFYSAVSGSPSRRVEFYILMEFEKDVLRGIVFVAEALCAAIFRVMPDRKWDQLLPDEIKNWIPTSGLNVASPIHGAHGRGWIGFDKLRDSDDPEVRKYYRDAKVKGQATQMANRRARSKATAVAGDEIPLMVKNGSAFSVNPKLIRGVTLTIPKDLAQGSGLVKGDEIALRYEITDSDHPHKFIRNARRSDDCRRLGIEATWTLKRRFRGLDPGNKYTTWLTRDCQPNRKAVKIANSILDVLSEVPVDGSVRNQDRFYNIKDEDEKWTHLHMNLPADFVLLSLISFSYVLFMFTSLLFCF